MLVGIKKVGRMKYHFLVVFALGTLACSREQTKPSSNDQALDELHAAQLDELEEQHKAEREALNRAHEHELEAQVQAREVKSLEQRQSALLAQELSGPDLLNAVIEDLALARCTRAQRCGVVGPENVETLLNDCISRLSAKFRGELRPTHCEKGVVPAGVEGCLSTLRQETCANELESLKSVSECRVSSLCAN